MLDEDQAPRPVNMRAWIITTVTITGVLVAINLIVKFATVGQPTGPWRRNFDMNWENNIPTMWNSILLLAVGFSLILVAALTPRRRVGWLLAGILAVLMASDEYLVWHENLHYVGLWMGIALPTYAWVVPGGIIGLVLLALAWRWTARIPSRARFLLRVAVLTFGLGAVGVDAIGGYVEVTHGIGRIYQSISAVEEATEMLACTLAVVAAFRALEVVPLAGGRAALAPKDVTNRY